jgi:hypothetical protein
MERGRGREKKTRIKARSSLWPSFEPSLPFWNFTKIKQSVEASSMPLVCCVNLGVEFEVEIMKFCGNFTLESIAFTFSIPQRKKKFPAM